MGELKLNLIDEVEFEHVPNDKQLIAHYDEHAKYSFIIQIKFFFLLKKNNIYFKSKNQ